ncbi:MAG: tRNA (guanosine(37)-N1)-methyltransferase TrmD [Armatimonadetes bacterium]|nr:tRNA (guanosine(37)-N1)-methyltransferase TrmD [Armatimonadota bacterium]
MRIDIITAFPETFRFLNFSIIKRAQEKNNLKINLINLRDFSLDKHKTIDEPPYGGGAGMVLKPEPIFKAVKSIKNDSSRIILMCPQGKLFNQTKAKELSKERHLIFICGHYEGVDERVRVNLINEEISIGDYILTGGELPAMVIIDALVRLIPGVIEENSLKNESFNDYLLDYPQYTRPFDFDGFKVPEILLSGNHKEINSWRKKESLKRTYLRRPEFLKQDDLEFLKNLNCDL